MHLEWTNLACSLTINCEWIIQTYHEMQTTYTHLATWALSEETLLLFQIVGSGAVQLFSVSKPSGPVAMKAVVCLEQFEYLAAAIFQHVLWRRKLILSYRCGEERKTECRCTVWLGAVARDSCASTSEELLVNWQKFDKYQILISEQNASDLRRQVSFFLPKQQHILKHSIVLNKCEIPPRFKTMLLHRQLWSENKPVWFEMTTLCVPHHQKWYSPNFLAKHTKCMWPSGKTPNLHEVQMKKRKVLFDILGPRGRVGGAWKFGQVA